MSKATEQDRFRGCLLGLAAGDALGTTLEFKRPGTFEPIGDMVGGGPFGLQAGQWTDDTSMALCLATSLIECGGFDAADQMQRYVPGGTRATWPPRDPASTSGTPSVAHCRGSCATATPTPAQPTRTLPATVR